MLKSFIVWLFSSTEYEQLIFYSFGKDILLYYIKREGLGVKTLSSI